MWKLIDIHCRSGYMRHQGKKKKRSVDNSTHKIQCCMEFPGMINQCQIGRKSFAPSPIRPMLLQIYCLSVFLTQTYMHTDTHRHDIPHAHQKSALHIYQHKAKAGKATRSLITAYGMFIIKEVLVLFPFRMRSAGKYDFFLYQPIHENSPNNCNAKAKKSCKFDVLTKLRE